MFPWSPKKNERTCLGVRSADKVPPKSVKLLTPAWVLSISNVTLVFRLEWLSDHPPTLDWSVDLSFRLEMGTDTGSEVHASWYAWHHGCCTFLSPGHAPLARWSVLLSSSFSAVQPVPGRSPGLSVPLPGRSGRSAKEAGQESPCSCQGQVEQPKRRQRGVCFKW